VLREGGPRLWAAQLQFGAKQVGRKDRYGAVHFTLMHLPKSREGGLGISVG
jgi:hypothetical protein